MIGGQKATGGAKEETEGARRKAGEGREMTGGGNEGRRGGDRRRNRSNRKRKIGNRKRRRTRDTGKGRKRKKTKNKRETRQVLGRPACDRGPCMRPRSDPPKMKNSTPAKIVAEKKKKKNNEANWMVSNSAKLDRRTKQHTQFGVSASNGSRDMARTKLWQKKK